MNSFFLQAGGLGWLREPAKTVKIKNFSVVLYIYFNSFNSFICFRVLLVVLFQHVTTVKHIFFDRRHIFFDRRHIFFDRRHIFFDIANTPFLMYNIVRHNFYIKVNTFGVQVSKVKRGVGKPPLKFSIITWR